MNLTDKNAILWRLKSELAAYVGGVADSIKADGEKALPWAVLNFANWLGWHAATLDSAEAPDALSASFTPSVAELARGIKAAVRPLCGATTPPAPTAGERIAALEAQCANLRQVLASRKGEVQNG